MPSGAIINKIATKLHINQGAEVTCDQSCHIINFETDGPAATIEVDDASAFWPQWHLFPLENVCLSALDLMMHANRRTALCEATNLHRLGTICLLGLLDAVTGGKKSRALHRMDKACLKVLRNQIGHARRMFAQKCACNLVDFSKGLGRVA